MPFNSATDVTFPALINHKLFSLQNAEIHPSVCLSPPRPMHTEIKKQNKTIYLA